MSPLETRPQSVAIVALGPSQRDYFAASCTKKNPLRADEVWVVNSAANVVNADKIWIMDDLRHIERLYKGWANELRLTKTPIMTCRQYDDFPTSVAYPLEEVGKCIKDDTFTTTIAYMIAYAIYIKVKDLYLFGVDFWYPNSQAVESGLGAVGYLLGIAKERGVHFKIPQSSTLLDANLCYFDQKIGRMRRPLYGYDFNPGKSKDRVNRGIATELDEKIAAHAPEVLPKAMTTKLDGDKDVHAENP